MNAPSVSLAQVLAAWMTAKEDERKAVEHRRELDLLIRSMLPVKDEGSVSQEEGNYEVKVQYKLDRKLDVTALQVNWASLPVSVQDSIKWKAELSTTEYRKLQPTDLAALAPFVTIKPASPSVAVTIKE